MSGGEERSGKTAEGLEGGRGRFRVVRGVEAEAAAVAVLGGEDRAGSDGDAFLKGEGGQGHRIDFGRALCPKHEAALRSGDEGASGKAAPDGLGHRRDPLAVDPPHAPHLQQLQNVEIGR